MNRAASPAIALNGLCVGISSAAVFSSLGQSGSSFARLNASVWVATMAPVTAAAAFFTSVTLIYYTFIYNRGGGSNRRRNREVMFFILCTSVGLLDLVIFIQPGAMYGFQAPLFQLAAAGVLLPLAAAATFFLAVLLVYVYLYIDAAGNEWNPAVVVFLNKVTLAATVVTAVICTVVCNTK